MTDILHFPRPMGVPAAEAAVEITLDDPTLAEALEMFGHVADGWPRLVYRILTVSQLVQVARDAQSRFLTEARATPQSPDAIRAHWRAMRGAQLVLSSRTIARIGGPFHA